MRADYAYDDEVLSYDDWEKMDNPIPETWEIKRTFADQLVIYNNSGGQARSDAHAPETDHRIPRFPSRRIPFSPRCPFSLPVCNPDARSRHRLSLGRRRRAAPK
jgi:hypothetical protein